MNWLSLLDDSDPQALKDKVSLSAVVSLHGVELKVEGDRLVGLCPFHEDTSRPSFAVWRSEEDNELCGCWSCDFQPGDVFDFLQRKLDISFGKAMGQVAEYARNGLPPAPIIPERDADAPLPDLAGPIRDARLRPLAQLHSLFEDRGIDVPADWVGGEFRVGVTEDGKILIPHYDENDELRGGKWRTIDRKPVAYPGTRLDALYGAWRGRGRKHVVLCEGESDTWVMAWLLRGEDVDVFGLPSGVAARPREQWIEMLRNKHVTILFDADDAGRRGCAKWLGKLFGISDDIRVASLPAGDDAVSAGANAALRAVREAWPYVDPNSLPIDKVGDRYARVNPQTGATTILSDFTFQVERLITADEGVVFEVRMPTRNDVQVLTAAELSNSRKMQEWCAQRLAAWKGGSRDVADLLETLKAESLLVPRVVGTDVIGLHDGSFVTPKYNIGSSAYGFVPGTANVGLEEVLRLEHDAPWDRRLPATLTQLHKPEVITPLLGWIAAAPLRSLCEQFPILGCTGGAGFGKTTLIQTVLSAFGFWESAPMTLSATTAHGVQSYVQSTNSFPIWFDEYRHGARIEAKLALDQILRDAWDGSAAVKGGYGDNKVAIRKLYARAPVLVTGEDAFSETSHAERMVLIPMPMDGKNPEALDAYRSMKHEGFGRAYLQWLVEEIRRGTLTAPPKRHTRMELARATAEWGYSLLREFVQQTCAYDLMPFDESRILHHHTAMNATPVMIELLLNALNQSWSDGFPLVWVEGQDILVRHVHLVKWADVMGVTLPGNAMAVKTWYEERFDCHTVRSNGQRILRLVGAVNEIDLR